MKRIVWAVFVIIIMLLSNSPCSALTNVIVIGNGITKEEAIRDGLRSATEIVNGVMLISETKVSNNALVNDNITTASNGYIKSYEVLSSSVANGYTAINLKVNIDDTSIDTFIKRELGSVNTDKIDNDINVVKAKISQIKRKKELLDRANEQLGKSAYYAEVVGYKIIKVTSSEIIVNVASRLMVNKFAWDTYNKIISYFSKDDDDEVKAKITKSIGEFTTDKMYNFRIISDNSMLTIDNYVETLCNSTTENPIDPKSNKRGLYFQIHDDILKCHYAESRYVWRDGSNWNVDDYSESQKQISKDGLQFNNIIKLNNPELIREIPNIKFNVVYPTQVSGNEGA